MMNSTNELTESLTGGTSSGDDAASMSSQRSASLLQRIQMQRHREHEMAQQHQPPLTSQVIQVPQYNPVAPEENFAGGGIARPPPETEGSGFFSTAWNTIHSSMEQGMSSMSANTTSYADDGMGADADDALLMPSSMGGEEGEYSMSNYFFQALRDFNQMFYALPVPARVVVVVVLLYIALKLL